MNCHATRAVLDLLAEGGLSPRRESAARAHLDSCSACRAHATPAAKPSSAGGPSGAWKAKLKASLADASAGRVHTGAGMDLSLWPRDVRGVLFAALALALVAVFAGWSGAPSQLYSEDGGEVARRLP